MVQGGIYHGRIIMPSDYPFRPPAFMLLTPNGRFETGVKICLSISAHHPEHWQPSWSVRTALTALVAFMPSPGNGAIGSLVRLHPLVRKERSALSGVLAFVILARLVSERALTAQAFHGWRLNDAGDCKASNQACCCEAIICTKPAACKLERVCLE